MHKNRILRKVNQQIPPPATAHSLTLSHSLLIYIRAFILLKQNPKHLSIESIPLKLPACHILSDAFSHMFQIVQYTVAKYMRECANIIPSFHSSVTYWLNIIPPQFPTHTILQTLSYMSVCVCVCVQYTYKFMHILFGLPHHSPPPPPPYMAKAWATKNNKLSYTQRHICCRHRCHVVCICVLLLSNAYVAFEFWTEMGVVEGDEGWDCVYLCRRFISTILYKMDFKNRIKTGARAVDLIIIFPIYFYRDFHPFYNIIHMYDAVVFTTAAAKKKCCEWKLL